MHTKNFHIIFKIYLLNVVILRIPTIIIHAQKRIYKWINAQEIINKVTDRNMKKDFHKRNTMKKRKEDKKGNGISSHGKLKKIKMETK